MDDFGGAMNSTLTILLVLSLPVTFAQLLGRSTTPVSDQMEVRSEPCLLATAYADNSISRRTGSLRSDGQSAEEVLSEFQRAIKERCARFSAQALRQVSVSVGENYIVISGTVPSEGDEEQLISIAVANADGRTVFNRLSLEPGRPPIR